MMLSRYQRFDDIPAIKGYVVNVFDSLNFDIDLDLPDTIRRRYANVISNKYTYKDDNGQIKTGTAYRCRLRGISVLTKSRGRSNYRGVSRALIILQRKAHVDIIHQIDRQNGQVLVTASDVDIYRRLLIDIFDPISNIDMRSLILRPEYQAVYQVYQGNSTSQEQDSEESFEYQPESKYDFREEHETDQETESADPDKNRQIQNSTPDFEFNYLWEKYSQCTAITVG